MSFNPGEFRPSFGSPGDRRFWGKNPEPGAALTYYLRTPARAVTARITDAAGAVVRELAAENFADELAAGVHRVQWDLRHQPLPDSLAVGGRGGGGGAAARAPFVPPGAYRVALSVDGREAGMRTVTVKGDTLSRIADADRALLHAASLATHQLHGIAGAAALRVAALSSRLRAVQTLLQQSANPPAALRASVDALDRRLAALRRQFAVTMPGEAPLAGRGGGGGGGGGAITSTLAGVKGQLLNSTSRPSEVQLRQAREAREDLAAAVTEINDITTAALPAVYQSLGQPQLAPARAPVPAVTIRLP
jgi:hypothetical protein